MLDIEFLANRVPFSGGVLYRYRTGLLRPAVLKLIDELSVRSGAMLVSYEANNLELRWDETEVEAFLPGIRVCHLKEPRMASHQFKYLKQLFCTKPGQPTFIMVRSAQYNEGPHPGILLVDEPIVSAHNIQKLVQYVASQSDIPYAVEIANQQSFLSFFRRWIDGEGEVVFPTLLQEFERVMLLYSEPGTPVFAPPHWSEPEPTCRSFLVNSLSRYLRDQDTLSRAALLQALSLRSRRGYTEPAVVSDFVLASTRVLTKVGERLRTAQIRSCAPDVSKEAAALWGALVVAWEHNRSEGDRSARLPLLADFEHLCHDFEARVSDLVSDPLIGRWASLVRIRPPQPVIDTDDQISNPVDDLLEVILTITNSRSSEQAVKWIDKLHRLLLRDHPEQPSFSFLGACRTRQLRSFADVIGQSHIISKIEKRFATDSHIRPLILIGPPGSGGQAIASLYARALLCEARMPDSIDPCGSCSTCTGGSFGYGEIDMGNSNALNQSKSVAANFRFRGFSDRNVIVLKNADHADEALDVLLKTMEDAPSKTTYIVLARSEEQVRASALSRGARYHLQRASEAEATNLARRWLSVDQDFDQVTRLISLHGDYRPGIIWHLLQQLEKYNVGSLREAKAIFGLEWAERSTRYFQAAFEGRFNEAIELLHKIDVEPTRIAEKLREFLGTVNGHWTGEAAFVGLDEDVRQLSDRCAAAAARHGLKPQQLWDQLSRYWLENSVIDRESLNEAGDVTQSIANGFARYTV